MNKNTIRALFVAVLLLTLFSASTLAQSRPRRIQPLPAAKTEESRPRRVRQPQTGKPQPPAKVKNQVDAFLDRLNKLIDDYLQYTRTRSRL